MKLIHTFISTPSLPNSLECLRALALNLRWTWNHETSELFRRLDSDLWESTGHNPMLMLGTIDQDKLEAAAANEGFMAHMDRVCREMSGYQKSESTWFNRVHGHVPQPLVAYFSAEFGITECLSIFAGGLGVLAGDHLKSASDLGLPLVGIGLLYQQGYFRQYLNEAGWQQEAYENNDFHNLPIVLLRRSDGSPLTVQVPLPDGDVVAQIWKVQVGRIPLYLLDTNTSANKNPIDRDITDQLYGGDRDMRLKQEIVLGIGGFRALEVLGLNPTVYHMNEGHSALLALERIRRYMYTHKLTFDEAREAASGGLVFTTHTSVEAGHDYFSPDLMLHYLAGYVSGIGLTQNEFMALGRKNPNDQGETFCMTILALRLAARSNGVSRLHGEVSRRMWNGLWQELPEGEVPLKHVTNGVHFMSWISREMKELYDRYLGPRWREEPADQSVWEQAHHIAAEELWRTHERRRERLVAFCRHRLWKQLDRRGASKAALEAADEMLDPEALTIGFSRRFATYKRATLLLHDLDRLSRILNDPDRPVQVIIAGKAHPRDDPGKELIRQIVDTSHGSEFKRLVFIEDYDVTVARYLVQGSDVWLNTPLRRREASGTSGMKAIANGVLNLSILDGWWDEAYKPEVGWAIGRRETYDDRNYRDQVEAEALYGLLEQEVVPAFYERGGDGLPRRWINYMKHSIQSLCCYFNTHRMVSEYIEKFYLPAYEHGRRMTENKMARAKALAAWKKHIRSNWKEVRIDKVSSESVTEVRVGGQFEVSVRVFLGKLVPEDVTVELYMGQVDPAGDVKDARTVQMIPVGQEEDGSFLYQAAEVSCTRSGLHGYTVRIHPHHDDLATPYLPGLITWA